MNIHNHQLRVAALMKLIQKHSPSEKAYLQAVPDKPTIPPEDVRKLRARIIIEEALETVAGLGFDVLLKEADYEGNDILISTDSLEFEAVRPCDIIQVVDGCSDIRVVTTGTECVFGITAEPMQQAIDLANLKKFEPGGYMREDGKWMKPPGWQAPDLMALLVRQGYQP